MHNLTDPANMTPSKRTAELAAIFAAGFVRLSTRAGHVPLAPEAPGEGSELPASSAKRLSESTGCVRQDEAQCPPRTNDARKGRRA